MSAQDRGGASSTIATLPAVTCAPWCEDGAGHVNADHPDDQVCMSEGARLELTAMPLLTYKGETSGRDYLDVFLMRAGYSTRATVELTHADRTVVELTVSEARDLAQRLLRLVETAEAGTA